MSRVVFFDLETAGLALEAPVIQLAAIAVETSTWGELATFEAKIAFDPFAPEVEWEALRVNQWTAEAWTAARSPLAVSGSFAHFLRPFCDVEFISKRTGRPYQVARLAGHNASGFDEPRLTRLFGDAFRPWDPRVLDTCQLAQWWMLQHPATTSALGEPFTDYKLGSLCRFFGITVDAPLHDALTDVRLTVALARALLTADLAR